MGVKLVTDSTSYIPLDVQETLEISVIPLSVNFPDESFLETEVDYSYFYNKIESSGVIPTSSQPSVGDMEACFRRILDGGHDIVAIFISAQMSGTYEAAVGMREQLVKEYPDAGFAIYDSKTNCMSLGHPVVESAKAAKEGRSFDEVCELAVSLIARMHFYFTPATLDYLQKGGRIGGASALLGRVLKIRPVLFVDEGSTNVYRKARGFQGAINEILKRMDSDIQDRGIAQIIVMHIHYQDKAEEIAQTIEERYGIAAPILPIGPVIGLHVGPGTIGIVYCTDRA